VVYSSAFFGFQIDVARTLARRFDLTLHDALYHYTTLSKTAVGSGTWGAFAEGLAAADNLLGYTERWYHAHRDPDPAPGDAEFHGRPLFGCFYYVVRDETIIRPHFIKNDPHGGPLGRARMPARLAELRAMFGHIRRHEPRAASVRGNSWLYNLEAYRRLYPPAYVAGLPESDEGEYQFLARWGQLFDHRWAVRQPAGARFLRSLEQLASLDDLRRCFPYQIRQPQCEIAHFYDFYAAEGSGPIVD
jgi:hypothetical protein